MSLKGYFCILFYLCVCNVAVCGQDNEFNDAVTTIMRDAPNHFRNIKGKTSQQNMNAIVYESGVKVPGTIASRFVFSKGMYYEGALLQTKEINEVSAIYDKYVGLLAGLLLPREYTQTMSDNFYPGLEKFKKVAFLPKMNNETKIDIDAPHLALEVMYSKEKTQYTVVMFIFEH